MNKEKLWLFMAKKNHPQLHLVMPTLCWIADENGVKFECYLESGRDGELFAENGSMVLSGNHFQQFNYLNLMFDVSYIILGDVQVFKTSINMFGNIIAQADNAKKLYNILTENLNIHKNILYVGNCKKGSIDVSGYLYQDIYFGKYLALPQNCNYEGDSVSYIFTGNKGDIDTLSPDDTYETATLRMAERNKKFAKGVAFGDPPLILPFTPMFCREKRVTVYEECIWKNRKEIHFSNYMESTSKIVKETAKLASEFSDKIMVGRQTSDGDLFEWSKSGICMRILDPNRPVFPVIETLPSKWYSEKSYKDEEPDDAQLEKYAKEGKILCSVIAHSGEVAHNEAMLNLAELCSFTGFKMGLGVHAQRYKTCPQLWELINVPKENGGFLGNIEPILHAGGMGVLAESHCPVDMLKQYILEAKEEIKNIVGENNVPCGYYAFCDTDYETLQTVRNDIFAAVEECGFEYFVSSAQPGINKVLYDGKTMQAFNQSSRAWCGSSPFVRISTHHDIKYYNSYTCPGWFIGTIDAPVVSFIPNIWRKGNEFMKIIKMMTETDYMVNVTPHVISRYINILKKMGFYE